MWWLKSVAVIVTFIMSTFVNIINNIYRRERYFRSFEINVESRNVFSEHWTGEKNPPRTTFYVHNMRRRRLKIQQHEIIHKTTFWARLPLVSISVCFLGSTVYTSRHSILIYFECSLFSFSLLFHLFLITHRGLSPTFEHYIIIRISHVLAIS